MGASWQGAEIERSRQQFALLFPFERLVKFHYDCLAFDGDMVEYFSPFIYAVLM